MTTSVKFIVPMVLRERCLDDNLILKVADESEMITRGVLIGTWLASNGFQPKSYKSTTWDGFTEILVETTSVNKEDLLGFMKDLGIEVQIIGVDKAKDNGAG